ncbi:MAG: hypothetical protein Q8P89_03960 [bacterium]|nr:hypothetical protein [bacterium]
MSGKDLLIFSILTFLTVVGWIVSEAYHASATSTLTTVEQKLMEPLNPSFDQNVIIKLKERHGF